MFGFRKNSVQPDVELNPPASRVEIQVAKNANKAVKEKAKRVNEDVKGLLVENGITVTIALAASNRVIKRGGA